VLTDQLSCGQDDAWAAPRLYVLFRMHWVILTADRTAAQSSTSGGRCLERTLRTTDPLPLNSSLIKHLLRKQSPDPRAKRFVLRSPFENHSIALRVLRRSDTSPASWDEVDVVYLAPELVLDRVVSDEAAAVLRCDPSITHLKRALCTQRALTPPAPVLLVDCFGPGVYVHDALCWLQRADDTRAWLEPALILRLQAATLWSSGSDAMELLSSLERLLNEPAFHATPALLVVDDVDIVVEQHAFNGVLVHLETIRDETPVPLLLVRYLDRTTEPAPAVESLLGERGLHVEVSQPFENPAQWRDLCEVNKASATCDFGPNHVEHATWQQKMSAEIPMSPANMLYGGYIPWPQPQHQHQQPPQTSCSISEHDDHADQVYIVPRRSWHELSRLIAIMNSRSWPSTDTIAVRPTGALLYGPPGCGKTALLRQMMAVFRTSDFEFVTAADVSRALVGESERLLSARFTGRARGMRLGMLVFDEADALFPGRHVPNAGLKHLSGALLEHLDKLRRSDHRLLVFLATNRPWQLDRSLFLGDKFDCLLYLGPPGPSCRAQLLRRLKLLPAGTTCDGDLLVARTAGFSYADLLSIRSRMQRTHKSALETVSTIQPSVSREERMRFEHWNTMLQSYGVEILEPSSEEALDPLPWDAQAEDARERQVASEVAYRGVCEQRTHSY